jgi:hypothetical protein
MPDSCIPIFDDGEARFKESLRGIVKHKPVPEKQE